ncbi:hypothetical protein [Streptomyces endophyticus]|uniref:Integral membrane protein n=1 Tax=Streptomyces endophyticus TaxID=714166 RepID=A0ABU6FHA8_9ACTN|nr:hypothetical protein [Streptomyces endophyticus]MEB8342675.1 hypothetical protein [Streptomyces endophyticus]
MPPSSVRRPPVGLALLVPVLVLASAALLAAHFSFEGDTFQHCRYLGPSVRMYVTAWAAPLCGAAAVGALLVLRRGERRRRTGGRPGETYRGRRLAVAAICLVPVLLLVQLAALYWVYAPDPAGGQDCSGLMVTRALP